MELRLTNGSTVTRVYGSATTELLAGFQYELDAMTFAKLKLAEDAERKFFDSHYIVCCHYNGKVEIFRHPEKKVA